MRRYSPYVGLNRLHRKFAEILDRLNIARFTNPDACRPLLKETEVSRKLQQDKDEIMQMDVQQKFRAAAADFEATVRRSLGEAHCLINGKWLVSHLAVSKTGKSADACRKAWIAHVASIGGLTEVKDWWARVIGKAP
jgi:hypothetical protein